MKNIRKSAVWESPNKLMVKELAIPQVGQRELLIKVHACAICGSDLRTLKHGNPRVQSGQIVGHEISGTVVKVGAEVTKFKVGDRLSIGADVPCGKCIHCLSGRANCCDTNYAIGHQFEGGFCEYMLLNELVVSFGPVKVLSANTNMDDAALAEPLACCINGYERCHMNEGKSIVVFGAGPIGLMLCMLGFEYRASKIILIDPNQKRLDFAKNRVGNIITLCPSEMNVVSEVMSLTEGTGADLIFTACPSVEAHEQAIQMVAKRGVVNLFGGLPAGSKHIVLDSNYIHYREAYITGSHGSTPEQHAKAVDLIESGRISVKDLITHRFGIDDVNAAYECAASGEAIKVLVTP